MPQSQCGRRSWLLGQFDQLRGHARSTGSKLLYNINGSGLESRVAAQGVAQVLGARRQRSCGGGGRTPAAPAFGAGEQGGGSARVVRDMAHLHEKGNARRRSSSSSRV